MTSKETSDPEITFLHMDSSREPYAAIVAGKTVRRRVNETVERFRQRVVAGRVKA